MNPKLSHISESPTLHIADQARAIERSGRRVIKLQTGDPDFDTPGPVIHAAIRAMEAGDTHYCATRGLPALRETIAERSFDARALSYDPATEILVTHGGVHAVYCAVTAMLAPGDEVVILDPSWMPYVSAALAAGGVPVRVGARWERRFKPTIAEIEACLSDRTRLLILNTPTNPTGQVWSREELQRLANLLVQRDLMAISDEVYESLVYDDCQHISLASLPGMRERTVVIGSFSKTYAMTGWRVGYLAASPEITAEVLKLSQYSITNVAPFIQRAAITALTDDSVGQFVEQTREIYTARRALLLDALSDIPGIRVLKPQGAFYALIDVSAFAPDSSEFAMRLLEEENVCLAPGVGFGKSSEGTLRATFAVSEASLTEGVAGLRRLVTRWQGQKPRRMKQAP